jgi:hypothetical protein
MMVCVHLGITDFLLVCFEFMLLYMVHFKSRLRMV